MTAGIGHNSGEEPEEDFSDLENLTLQEILEAGKKAMFILLVGRCRSGTASHQEMSILRNVLKDNGMVLGIAPEQPAATEAPMDLPEFGKPDYEA